MILRDAARLIKDNVRPDDVEPETPYIGLEHIAPEKLSLLGIGKACEVTSMKQKFNCGDILFGKLRPYFRKVIQPKFGGICSTDIWVVRANRGYDPGFLRYWLSSWNFVNYVNEASEGTRMPRAKWDVAEKHKILDFSTKEQKAIAHILGTLDGKIELNQQMNETLESMAQAIFQDWFIDFGPTRRKMQGATDPDIILGGLFATSEKSREVADLFPSELIESELGKIPQGWEVNTLGQHIFLTKGRSYKKMELQDSDVALVTLKSFLRGGGYRHDGLKSYIGKYKEEQIVEEGDLIIALTDVTQAADVIGKPAIARNSTKYTTHVASLDVGIVRMFEGSPLTKIFCYYLMLADRYTSHSLGYTSGTTVLHLSKKAAMDYKFVLPSNKLMQKINAIISLLYSDILNSEKENEILFSLFELLLPKLISGEIGFLSDSEKFVEY